MALSDRVDLESFLSCCLQEASWSSTSVLSLDPIHIEYAKHKANVTLLFSNRDIHSVVDIARVSDTLLFLAMVDESDPDGLVDELGYHFISALHSLGLPETICFAQGLHSLSGKTLIDLRKLSRRYFESAVGTNIRVCEDSEVSALSRHMTAITPKNLNWRLTRSYMRCESVEIVDDIHQINEEGTCSLRLRGYLRGQPLSVQSLVHITDVGTFPISKISLALSPFDLKPSSKHKAAAFVAHSVLSDPTE